MIDFGVNAERSSSEWQPDRADWIRGVGVVAPERGALDPKQEPALGKPSVLEQEFPHVPVTVLREPPKGAAVIPELEWLSPSADLYVWDAEVLKLGSCPDWLILRTSSRSGSITPVLLQILTRYQRWLPRRNQFSQSDLFERALARHRELHDLAKPLVRADYEHALDTWQWLLRLMPRASLALQLAALFHDVERLFSEPDQRIEHTAPDYQAFKNAHARGGAAIAGRVLGDSGVSRADRLTVEALIEQHELPLRDSRYGECSDLAVLGDADALSFFSLNSPSFADHYGAEHTRKKVRYSLGRMTDDATERLLGIKLRHDIARLVGEAGYATSRTGEEVHS